MPNNLQFTTQVNVPNLRNAKITNVFVDEDGARMRIEINVTGAGGILHRREPWVLSITNGSADALVAQPSPAVILESMQSVSLGGAGVASAYTTAIAAYRSAGGDKRGNLLTALQGISGVVQNGAAEVGALAGTTQPILPPGVVS